MLVTVEKPPVSSYLNSQAVCKYHKYTNNIPVVYHSFSELDTGLFKRKKKKKNKILFNHDDCRLDHQNRKTAYFPVQTARFSLMWLVFRSLPGTVAETKQPQ